MMLRSIGLFHVRLPLRMQIKHASHERTASDSLIVRATLDDGSSGFGEGVPRPYVTGESIDSTFQALRACDAAKLLESPLDIADVVRRLEAFDLAENLSDPRGMAANSARCALEVAVLDAYGKHFGKSVSDAVRLAPVAQSWLNREPRDVRYSGAITAESPRRERIGAWKMRLYGFAHVKIKVGVPGQDDARRLRALRRILGRKTDIRLDANEAWHSDQLLDRVAPLVPFGPSVLEQPLPHGEVKRLAELRPKLGLPIMLDESLCGWPDAIRAVEGRWTDYFNVRISKCGGILPSLRLVDLAFRSGLKVQLGCHPGESGLLSAAGRHVAANIQSLSYVEGSYDRHVLSENLIVDDITFGYGGRAKPLSGPGLGVTVDPGQLEKLTIRSEILTYG